MLARYTTRNSVYEIDWTEKTIRRADGAGAPTSRMGAEPQKFDAAMLVNYGGTGERVLYVSFPTGPSSITSSVLDVEEIFPDPSPCQYEIPSGSYDEPPAMCDRDALEGSEFCEEHDPDTLIDVEAGER